MPARSRDEGHRASTPLELIFDLVFVVAVAQASAALHHGLGAGHVLDSVITYAAVFFALWWAWMNFTWFASAYDNDDVPYRLNVFALMAGALIFAAGVPAFVQGDLRIGVGGYVVMRLAMIVLWLRAARHDAPRRRSAQRYALGIFLVQCAWVSLLFMPPAWLMPGFVVFAVCECLVPVWAERAGSTTWHAGHIAERYGLLTLIVLGESVTSLSQGVNLALSGSGLDETRLLIVAGGLLLLFSMWWFYFDRPSQHMLASLQTAFIWGYGHYFVFGAVAAVGAGLAAQVEHPDSSITAWAVAVPAAVYLGVLWALHVYSRCVPRHELLLAPAAAVLVLLCPLFAGSVSTLAVGGVLVLLLALKGVVRAYAPRGQ